MKRRVLLILMASSLIFVAACKKEVKKEVKPKKSVKVQAQITPATAPFTRVDIVEGDHHGESALYLGPALGGGVRVELENQAIISVPMDYLIEHVEEVVN